MMSVQVKEHQLVEIFVAHYNDLPHYLIMVLACKILDIIIIELKYFCNHNGFSVIEGTVARAQNQHKVLNKIDVLG